MIDPGVRRQPFDLSRQRSVGAIARRENPATREMLGKVAVWNAGQILLQLAHDRLPRGMIERHLEIVKYARRRDKNKAFEFASGASLIQLVPDLGRKRMLFRRVRVDSRLNRVPRRARALVRAAGALRAKLMAGAMQIGRDKLPDGVEGAVFLAPFDKPRATTVRDDIPRFPMFHRFTYQAVECH